MTPQFIKCVDDFMSLRTSILFPTGCSMLEMCQAAIDAQERFVDDTEITAMQMFHYSPTGELSAIWGWFEIAQRRFLMGCSF